ncbi:MAG: M1 family aminopeptidase [Bacteroidales bacterium]
MKFYRLYTVMPKLSLLIMPRFLPMIVPILLILFLFSCEGGRVQRLAVSGVSEELAVSRKENIRDIVYSLKFAIPFERDSAIMANVVIDFSLDKRDFVVLDFKPSYELLGDSQKVHDGHLVAIVNGAKISLGIQNEHIIIPKKYLKKGANSLSLNFVAGEQSLNRRQDLLYTLLVPDRARTLFPCFDQPNLKAKFNLSLDIPASWMALANGKVIDESIIVNKEEVKNAEGVKILKFSQTEPISTYLFSFVVGDFEIITESREGREISIYHKESDPAKVAQSKEIFDLIYSSLEWLEEFTAIDYPFTKYDIAIVPGFQYGGMEHMGATLYSDRRMFLEESATITEQLGRAKLIAHETSHMWFGDYVTMPWFNDVWIKEVFANWFASAIVSPLFPGIDHKLNFINTYFPVSYAQDRTLGATAIQQELDNLKNAGLVYNNIIYNKAPIVMEKLVSKIGESLFKDGIRLYLKRYAYSNASWDNLIEILDSLSGQNLTEWSNVWVKKRGRPIIDVRLEGDSLLLNERDPFREGAEWAEGVAFNGVPNFDGTSYALIVPDSVLLDRIIFKLKQGEVTNDVARLSSIINLYELCDAGYLKAQPFLSVIESLLERESNILIYSRALNYLSSSLFRANYGQTERILRDIFISSAKKSIINQDRSKRAMAFKAYLNVATSSDAANELYEIWEHPQEFKEVSLGERDLMRLSYELAVFFPEKADYIKEKQLQRMGSNSGSSSGRVKEFSFVFPAVYSQIEVRDSVFNSLLLSSNRGVEPWAAAALGYLNHRTREDQSRHYIAPALGIIEEIQATGDIFFPANWLSALLSGHSSAAARKIVEGFLDSKFNNSRSLNPMLRSKVLQASHHLFRGE